MRTEVNIDKIKSVPAKDCSIHYFRQYSRFNEAN